jgi:hypothetical protein
MSKFIKIIANAFDQFGSKSECEAFIRSQNPSNLYEVEKLIFDYISENVHKN